jgi:hypothetical protein
MKVAKTAFLLALSGFFLAPPANNQIVKQATKGTPQAGGGSVNGLLMSISNDDAATGPEKATRLIITFRNLATDDVTLAPGTLIDCGRSPAKTSLIKLNLTDSEGRSHRHLPYLGEGPPYAAFCAGQIIPFVAVLQPGASLSLSLEVGKYFDFSDSREYEEARFPARTYSLQAELTRTPSQSNVERPAAIRAWSGTVSSNTLQIQFDREFAAPLDNYPR